MMRAIVFLVSMSLMGAAASDTGCELDSGNAVTDAINSALNIWAADQRCTGALLEHAPVKCEQDVTASIQSVSALGGAIAEMASSCGGVKEDKCGDAVNALVGSTAGLASAGGLIADKCFKTVPTGLDGDINQENTMLGKCTVDSADSINSIFQASNTIHEATSRRRRRKSVKNALDTVSVIANLGSFIAASVSDCRSYHWESSATPTVAHEHHRVRTRSADCAKAVLAGIADLSSLAELGMDVSKHCEATASRLYLESKTDTKAATGNPAVLALAAILPITAVLSFVVGSRFSKSSQRSREYSTELEAGTE